MSPLSSIDLHNTSNQTAYEFEIDPEPEYTSLVDDFTTNWLTIVFIVVITGAITFLGSIANIINIVVFWKQGFNDTINISLLALAVADLGSLLTLLWMSLCFNPLFRFSNIPFESLEIQYLTAGWPHLCFGRIASWITAFITFERCLCVAMPMKVKNIITPRATSCVIITIYSLMIISVSPALYATRIGWAFLPQRNETLLSLYYIENGAAIEQITTIIVVFSGLCVLPIVIIFTVALIQSLVRKSKWRNMAVKMTPSSGSTEISDRDKKVVKMVTFISCIFVVCGLPSAINSLLQFMFSPDYTLIGRYRNVFIISWSVLFVLEATNSSVNIFLYYKMSSKYRAILRGLLRLNDKM